MKTSAGHILTPVLQAVARKLGCKTAEIETWLEQHLGIPRIEHLEDQEQRLAAIRKALRVGEAESVIESAATSAALVLAQAKESP